MKIPKVDKPTNMTLEGWRCRVYPNGRVLCAESVPYHKPMDDDEHRCDCTTRQGETIATYRLTV